MPVGHQSGQVVASRASTPSQRELRWFCFEPRARSLNRKMGARLPQLTAVGDVDRPSTSRRPTRSDGDRLSCLRPRDVRSLLVRGIWSRDPRGAREGTPVTVVEGRNNAVVKLAEDDVNRAGVPSPSPRDPSEAVLRVQRAVHTLRESTAECFTRSRQALPLGTSPAAISRRRGETG